VDEQIVTLPDGLRVLVRPIRPDDKEKLVAGMSRLSPESRYRRFLRPVERLTERELKYLTEIDYVDHFAWVAAAADEPGEPGIGVARYVRDPKDPEVAECAVAVIDDYQRRGIGTLLIGLLIRTAREHGITRFRAWVHTANRGLLAALAAAGADMQVQEGTMKVEVPLPADPDSDNPIRAALRMAASGELPAEPRS
jgi:RimJ/RimL family protein N-acetyltransferase